MPGETLAVKQRVAKIAEWVKEHEKIPTALEVMEITGISNQDTARQYIRRLKESMPEPDLTGIQKKLLDRVEERLNDSENPMDDSNLIKLLEFFIPKKAETKQIVEGNYTLNDGTELTEELANYRKILFGAETGNTEPLQ